MALKRYFTAFSTLLLVTILVTGLHMASISAQGGPTPAPDANLPLTVAFIGPFKAFVDNSVVFSDGTTVTLTTATRRALRTVRQNQVIIILARLVGDNITAQLVYLNARTSRQQALRQASLVVEMGQVPVATPNATAAATEAAQAPTLPAECQEQHPIALWLATALKTTSQEIAVWHCKGFVFSDIARAYLLVRRAITGNKSLTLEQVFERRQTGTLWVEIQREFGLLTPTVRPRATRVPTRRPAGTQDR